MIAQTSVFRFEAGRVSELHDQLAVEEPLQIQMLVGSSGKEQIKNIAITMRTPGKDEELAAGFLYTEGIISNKEDIVTITSHSSGENTVLIVMRGDYKPSFVATERNFYISSSCGVCGKASIDAVRSVSTYPSSDFFLKIPFSLLHTLPAKLKTDQQAFQSTGGLHACALFDTSGKLLMLREDVGRHNALDKLIGAAFIGGQLPADKHILLLSGRASFELVQKGAIAGIKIIAAIGAPSSLAVELAKEAGITLIGFLKEERFNIYSYPERITGALTSS